MPVITFDTAPLTTVQKEKLVREFTGAAAKTTGLPKEAFYVFIREFPLKNVGVGGSLLSEKKHTDK